MTNKAILFIIPGAAYNLIVIPEDSMDIGDQETIYDLYKQELFYEELIENINEIVLDQNIDEIMVIGPDNFADGLAVQLTNIINNDNVTVYCVGMEDEVDAEISD